MTELEKRLKHIEKTNAKRTDTYRKQQQKAEDNYNKIQYREQNKYLNDNLKKETQKRTNSNINIADNDFDNYNAVKNVADSYVSQRNRNDENVMVFTKERNQAKSNSIVNNIYSTSYQQAKKDEYNDNISSLKQRKEALEDSRKKNSRYYSKTKEIDSQIDDIDKQIKNTTKNYQDNIFKESIDSVYAGNGAIDENVQKYVSGQDIKLLKAEVEKSPELLQQREALRKKLEENEEHSVDAQAEEFRKKIQENDNKSLYANSYDEWLEANDEKVELDKAGLQFGKDNDNGNLFSAKFKKGMELASEAIDNSQDSINAIKLGIYDTAEDDADFSRLTRDEDKLRYYYLRGKYGKAEASKYVLYAVQQKNTIDGLKEAQENGTLEEFVNAGKSGFNGAGKGLLQAMNGFFGGVGSNSVEPADYDRLNSASDVTFQADAELSGAVKRFALNAVNTTANQLPSIGISLIPGMQGVGMATLSASAAGQAYNQAILEGKTAEEAITYGGIQGLLELATQKILGGQFGMNGALEKYGDKALKNVIPKLFKNEIFRTYAYQAGNILINSAGEFNEEAIQQLLEPYVRNISFGENNKQTLQNVEDSLYAGLLGMASAGMTNTAGTVAGAVTSGIANKISDKRISKAKDIINSYQEQLLEENQEANQTENTDLPTVETVISEAEANQDKAKRITKIIDKIDSGENVTDSEIAELKYDDTAAVMLSQMAGLKESRITANFTNEDVRAVINEAQNGKKNIDTTAILNNIRNDVDSNQNIGENLYENGSDETLNADEGNLTTKNQMATEDVTEPYMTSQLSEVSEAMPENENAQNIEGAYISRVENNSNKIINLNISNEKTGSTNIRKVESVDNGVAQLLMTNGDIVSADTLDFSNNENAEIILTNAGKYNSNVANTFMLNYDSSKSAAEEYSTAFNAVYRMAEKGISYDEIVSRTRGARYVLGDKTFEAAIRAGRNTANGTFVDNTTSKTTNSSKTITASQQNMPQNKNGNTNVRSEAVRINVKKAAKSLSTALGVKINVYQSDSSIRGYEQNGEIFINESYVNSKANSASEFNYILAHELTHTLEDSKYYDELKSFILNSRVYDDNLTSRDTTHAEEVAKRKELYEKNDKQLTTEEAERELIADFIADELLTNEECIKELAHKDKKLFVKVREFINNMIDNLKRFVRNSADITNAQKDLIHIKELYTKAFNDVKKNGSYSNEIKYSKKLGGYNPDVNITTDNVLKEYGIKNINNKYEVINKVSSELSKSYLSTEKTHKPITNIDTGLKIEIRKSGIRETFGNPKYYSNLTKDLKLAKIASMSKLAKMIKYGEVRAKDASNYHNPRSETKFTYLKSSMNIDGINYDITIDIKRLPDNQNLFYIHNLKIKKQETNSLRQISSNALSANLPLTNDNISQKDNIVNSNIRKNSKNDTKKYSIEDKDKWTPIKPCKKTQAVLDRLAQDKPVTLEAINELPEIQEGYRRRGAYKPTIDINTEERQQLRKDIQSEVEKLGSARLAKNGEWVYNGNVAKENRIDIVIGLPAAGKSTVLANPLSELHQSRIVDSDVVKEKLPEFNNGYGANNVHEESKLINEKILENSLNNEENIVLPIVGSDYVELVEKIQGLKEKGYSVYLHLNKLSMNKSLGRMLNRFLTDGRFLDPSLSFYFQNKPTRVFNDVLRMKGDLLDGYSEYSNDVEKGQDPIFIRGTENIQEAYKRRNKRDAETNIGDIQKSGRDGTPSIDEISENNETKEKYSVASDVESDKTRQDSRNGHQIDYDLVHKKEINALENKQINNLNNQTTTKSVDDFAKSGIIKTDSKIRINMQFFAKRSEDFATVILPKQEYAHVMSEIATNLTEEQNSKKVFRKLIGDYTYLVENNGFGDYRIIGKRKIK